MTKINLTFYLNVVKPVLKRSDIQVFKKIKNSRTSCFFFFTQMSMAGGVGLIGLVVVDSCLRCCEFESQHCILIRVIYRDHLLCKVKYYCTEDLLVWIQEEQQIK